MRLSKPVVVYKLKAALVSSSIFLVFALSLGLITYHYWYPGYLFEIDGGIQGLRLVYSVDFVLGPILSLVFFHPEKSRPKLVFDIVFVACIQLSAMVWGAYQVYSQRPIAVVYGSHRFISVAPGIMALQSKTAENMKIYSDDRPPYVYRRETVSEHERRKLIAILMRNGIHFEAQAWLFQPFLPNLSHVFENQKAIHRYIEKEQAGAWARRHPADSDLLTDYRFAPYEGRYANAMLVFSPEGRYLTWLPMGDAPLPEFDDKALESVDKAH